MNPKKPTRAVQKTTHRLMPFTVVLIGLFLASTTNPVKGQGNEAEKDDSPIELSLESLYHPLEKAEFVGSKPSTVWIDNNPSRLLIKRDRRWNEVDLSTGEEKAWELPEILTRRLKTLEGVTESSAKSLIDAAITKLKKSEDAILVKIRRGLVIVARDKNPKWISKDVTQWRDISINSSGTTLAYTKNHDLYVIDLASGKHLRLTNDGSDTTFNGRLDWTYQEEIFGRGNFKGFWLHPNGQWLAMMKIDNELVPEYTLGSSSSDRGVGQISRYPKAGDPIPHASLLIWDLRKIRSGRVPRPALLVRSKPSQERLITGVWWDPNHQCLLYSLSDRCQTWREIRRVQPGLTTGDSNYHRVAHHEKSEAWIEPPHRPLFLSNGDILWMSEIPTGYSQVYHLTLSNSTLPVKAGDVRTVTPTEVHVRNFWISPDESELIYTADHLTGTVEQHIYRIDLKSKTEAVKLTKQPGWSEPSTSPDWKWLLVDHSNATSPSHLTVSTLDSPNSEERQINSLTLRQKIRQPEFFSIPTPDGPALPAALIRPETSEHKTPVIVEVYGGPGTARVTNKWRGTQNLYRELLARQGIATFIVDNRSSAGRGMKDAWTIKGRVGDVEIDDLQTAIKWLKEQEWVDPDRLLIRGWSFGGYMTITAMTRTQEFIAGIAGGSVTDWGEYDAFYTERYMGLPKKNPKGYQETAPIHDAQNLHGSLLMIHGEADDNVHPSGTMRMARALQKAGHPFDLMIYPNEAHSIRKPENVWHMSKLTDGFIKKYLLP